MRLQNYWWLLIWPFIFGVFSLFLNMEREETVDGQKCIRWTPLAAYAYVAPLVIWAGWRRWFGDTEQYRSTFLNMPSSAGQIIPYMKGVSKGHLFRLFELLFRSFITKSDIAFFLVIAVLQIICLVYVYRKYSPDYWLSFFFFIASTDYLSWMHNGMRQFIAAALVFLCVPMIAQKRYLQVVLIVLVASQIHISALIVLPFVFVVNGKAWNMRTLAFVAGIVLMVVFVDRVTGFITQVIQDTVYESNTIYLTGKDDGTNIFRVLFYSVPAVVTWFLRSYIDAENDPLLNVCTNLSIVTAGFYVFSYFTSGIIMGAIPIYFSLSNYILIPRLLQDVFQRRSANLIRIIFILVYVVFFYYQCGPTWGLL